MPTNETQSIIRAIAILDLFTMTIRNWVFGK